MVQYDKKEKEFKEFISSNPIQKMIVIKELVEKDFNSLEIKPSEYLIHAKEMDQHEIPKRVFHANTNQFNGLMLITDKSTIYSGVVKSGEKLFSESGKQVERVALKVPHVNMLDVTAYKEKQMSQYADVEMTFENKEGDLESIYFTTTIFGVTDWINYIFSQQEILTSD